MKYTKGKLLSFVLFFNIYFLSDHGVLE